MHNFSLGIEQAMTVISIFSSLGEIGMTHHKEFLLTADIFRYNYKTKVTLYSNVQSTRKRGRGVAACVLNGS